MYTIRQPLKLLTAEDLGIDPPKGWCGNYYLKFYMSGTSNPILINTNSNPIGYTAVNRRGIPIDEHLNYRPVCVDFEFRAVLYFSLDDALEDRFYASVWDLDGLDYTEEVDIKK